MSFETVGNVLRRVVVFHSEASDHYTALYSSSTEERGKLLLHQLAIQQREQAAALKLYLEDAEPGILSTELQFPSVKNLWEKSEFTISAACDVQEISRQMFEIDSKLLSFYSQLTQEQLPPRLEEIFLRLAEQQETIARLHSFDAQEVQDL